jgi:hypothetical protein
MVGNEMFKDAHELVSRERYGRRWAVDPVSFDRPSPGHSAGEGARDDFGDGRHVGIGFPGGQQSARSRVGRISPNLRSPTRDEQNRRHHLCQAARLRMLEDYAAMHARDKGGQRCCPGYAVGARGPNELTPR